MAIKVNILEIVESERVADQGAKSERVEPTIHVWVQPPTPSKYKVNASKMTADQLNQLRENKGGQAWMELVAQLQQGGHAYYFKEGSDIEFISSSSPVPVSASSSASSSYVPKPETKPELTLSLTDQPVGDNKGVSNRLPQQTR